jgi:hypothetical protein
VLRPDATRRLTCDSVVVELRGFEPLTPCMPCHPHQFTRPFAALLSTASALLMTAPDDAPWWDARPRVESLLTTC